MKRVDDILKEKRPTFSFEFFPPKTPEGMENLRNVTKALAEQGADFFSVTYGAGGSTRELTLDIVDELQRNLNIPVLHHLTCVGYNEETLHSMIGQMRERNVQNIVALRGDPPKGQTEWKAAEGGFQYAYQLIDLIKKFDNHFSIGVAGFPEGHINCPDLETDTKYLKMKLDHGGQYIMTQFFFDNQYYYDYIKRLREANIDALVIPGILPIASYETILDMAKNNGTTLPQQIHDIFAPIANDKEATIEAGYQYALAQAKDLLDNGVPGIHFYALNRLYPASKLLSDLQTYIKK